MSSIVGAITGGGGSGMAFNAKGADLIQPVTKEQVDQAYLNTQTGLGQQNDFLNAVRAQGGLANQSSVFNQLQGVASGTGPNPAQAQLANATGANVANQAALMAGQRGSGANAGMMARQAANQGAGIQQNAAGQAAALQAQQSLGALNQMGGLATNQANQQANATNAFANTALQQQQNLLGGVGAYNNANVNMQSNLNSTNAGVQQVTAGAQGNMMGNMMGGIGTALMGTEGDGGMLGGLFSGGGGGIAEGAASGSSYLGVGGDASSASGFFGLDKALANGGMVQKRYADGGEIENSSTSLVAPTGPQSNVGRSFMESQNELGATPPPQAAIKPQAAGGGKGGGAGMPDLGQMFNIGSKIFGEGGEGLSNLGSKFAEGFNSIFGSSSALGAGLGETFGGVMAGAGEAVIPAIGEVGVAMGPAAVEAAPVVATVVASKGGEVPALVSPGEQYLPPKDVNKVKQGANPLEVGKRVPGTPVVGGAKNDYANDTVPAKLESGGIVIPRSVTQSEDAPEKAAAFVRAVLAKQGLKPSLKGK